MKPLTVCTAALILGLHLATSVGANDVSDYWYQGKAELSSYMLEQARYGEVHPGEAVLIFVTEDFSRKKHVKLDRPASADDRVPVLKLNFTKKFNTGIYPYSMMSSVFTPMDSFEADPATLKVTTSSQEWCGHTFTQLNRTTDGYHVTELSYFEAEGDQRIELEGAIPEDGLWNHIRVAPLSLPTGRTRLIPGTMYQRLSHAAWRAAWAEASLGRDPHNDARAVYTLDYPDLGRTLTIRFDTAFPHAITSWEESYVSGWGPSAARLTTRGTLKKRIMLDYWNHHDRADTHLREALALD